MGKEADHSTAWSRELGMELRRRRETARLRGRDIANILDWSPSKVCRLEKGLRGASPVDVANYYVACGTVERAEYERLLTLAKQSDGGYWLRTGCEPLPEQLRSLIIQESLASHIASYTSGGVHGLLQIEPYIRELFRWGSELPADLARQRIQVRLDRQRVLRLREGPQCTFFIQEHALRTVLGDARLMHEQLLHLVFATSLRSCTIRVVPDSAGPFSAVGDSFSLFQYVEHPPVVYTSSWSAGLFIEEPEALAWYRSFLSKLDRAALDEGQSRAWLANLASEYDRMEAGADDHPRPGAADLA